MMLRRLFAAGLVVTAVMTAVPAQAQADTTPPQLVSFAVSPTVVDPASSSQNVTVTAVITDDLSGVSGESNVELYSPSVDQWTYGFFNNTSGDTWTTTLTIPQFAENGVWRDWYFFVEDNATNLAVIDESDLLSAGMNQALGVGSFAESYSRTVSLRIGRTKASGSVGAALESACFWFVPVTLERRTASGWRRVGRTMSSYSGRFAFHITRDGRYRVTATSFEIGTPALTTCLRAARTATS